MDLQISDISAALVHLGHQPQDMEVAAGGEELEIRNRRGSGSLSLIVGTQGALPSSGSRTDQLYVLRSDGDLQINGSLTTGELETDSADIGVEAPQWMLAAYDTFESGASGWSPNLTSPCGGPNHILGGHCRLAGMPADKVFDGLHNHKAVRVEARFYFIDEWRGQSAWMMFDQTVVWVHQHTACFSEQIAEDTPACGQAAGHRTCRNETERDEVELLSRKMRNVSEESRRLQRSAPRLDCGKSASFCGRPDVPDMLGVLIDVTHAHTASQLTLTFGTFGLQGADPCTVSYGVQGVSIYVR